MISIYPKFKYKYSQSQSKTRGDSVKETILSFLEFDIDVSLFQDDILRKIRKIENTERRMSLAALAR